MSFTAGGTTANVGTTLAATALLSAFFASLYGWGRLALPLLYREPPGAPAFAAVLGLAIWTFLLGDNTSSTAPFIV